MYHLIITSLFLVSCFIARAQQLFTQNYPIEVYQGASQSWSIRQDQQGIIYVANTEGLLRYDGNKWELMSLPDKEAIYSVDIDSSGKAYVCADYDLGYFQTKSDGTYQYFSLLDKLPAVHKVNMTMSLVRVFNNKVFFLGEDYIYIYADNHFKVLKVRCKGLIVNQNNLYARKEDALYRYTGDGFESTPYFRIIEGMKYAWITDYGPDNFLILDEKNRVWIINEKHPDQWNIFSEELNRSLKNLNIQSMTCLDNGNIAVHVIDEILSYDEILFYDKSGKLRYHVPAENLMRWGYLFEDKQHNLWANADSNIIEIISSSPLSYFDYKNGVKDFVLSFGRKGNHHYVGTYTNLLYQEDDNTFTTLPITEGGVWSFSNIHNKLYALHDEGVLELEGKKVTRIVDHKYTFALCALRNHADKMIMGTYNTGIWLLTKHKNTWSKKKIKGFAEEESRAVQEDEEGNIWTCQFNRGIWKLKLNEQLDSVIAVTKYDAAKGLPASSNNRIYRIGGKIIAATIDGIYSYNSHNNRFEPEEKYRKALGKGFCIYTVAEDPEGNVYFWGARPKEKEMAGVLKKQPDGSFKLLPTPFNKISLPFRNLRVDVDAPILVTSSGNVWIGNNRKIFNYNPQQVSFYNEPITLTIQKVWARDSVIYQHSEKNAINTIPFTSNNLKFEFLCSFLEEPEKNQYQYKLEGFENKWSEWATSKEALFTNLSAGDYTFHVRAKNIYDVVSTPASFSFHINPPWYKTSLARFLYFISSILLVFLIIHLNTRRVKKQKLVLEEIINEKTKELIDVNEELLSQSNLLSEKNYQLIKAQTTIENQNKEITHRNETLEEEVDKRTKELVKYNQQLEQFAFVTAHNLRGPVARIMGLGTLMEMISEVPNEVKTISDKLVFTAKEIDAVIRDLNQILHIKNTPSPLEKFDLKVEMDKVISGLEIEVNDSKAMIRTDFSEVQSIITSKAYFYSVAHHLLSNAIKFRHPERKPEIMIAAIHAGDYICLAISDNGLGIDLQKNRDKLFTLYSRFHLHVEGKGLGLYLAKTQMLAISGNIEVESEVNIGTTFKVFFKKVQSISG